MAHESFDVIVGLLTQGTEPYNNNVHKTDNKKLPMLFALERTIS